MSKSVASLLREMEDLSAQELIEVLAGLSQHLQHKTNPKTGPLPNNGNGHNTPIPGTYQRTPEQIEASLAAIFTPEEIAEIGKRDFTQQPLPGKSTSQMLIEDREDRF